MYAKTRSKPCGHRSGDVFECDTDDEVATPLSGPKLYAVVSDCSFARHHTAQEAADDACEKARKNPGVNFYVLKPSDVCSVALPPVKVEAYVRPETA